MLTVIFIFTIFYTLYYLFYKSRPPKLIFNSQKPTGYFSDSSKIPPLLKRSWYPPFFLSSPHLQMFFYEGMVLHSPDISYQRHSIKSDHDGGVFAVDVLKNPKANNNYSEIVLVIPGMTGKSPDAYIKRVVNCAHNRSETTLVAVLIQRGFDGLKMSDPRAIKLQAATNVRDLTQVLKYLADEFGGGKTRIVAFSFGGIQTRLLLSNVDSNQDWYPRAALLTSTPLDIAQTAFKRFEVSLKGWVYNLVLTKRLKSLMMRHGISDDSVLSELKHIRQLDDQITGPAWGFKGWQDFYKAASINQPGLLNIKIPLIILNSDDDPLIYNDPEQEKWFAETKNVLLARSNSGGHCAFLRFGWLTWFYNKVKCCQAKTYFEELVEEFLELKLNVSNKFE